MKLNRGQSFLWVIFLFICIATPRVFHLGQFLTADEPRWQANVSGFTTKLSQGQLGDLVQQPHPGITTQWFAAAATFNPDWNIKKLPLALWQMVIVLLIGYVFWQLSGPFVASLLTLLLAFDPILIAHTRVLAMDSLLAEFSLLSIGLLLLWQKNKETRYLIFAGATAAAAFLSKLPGIIFIPFTGLCLIWWQGFNKNMWCHVAIYGASFIIGLIIILPSFAIHPLNVIGDFKEFFSSDDYNDLHQAPGTYYLSTLWFYSTPIQMLGVLGTVFFLIKKRPFKYTKEIITLGLFAILFVTMMSIGLKKGDRYILPAFLMFDAITAYVLGYLWQHKHKQWAKITLTICAVLFVWQMSDIANLGMGTYTLAYVNPLTKPFFGQHHLGWGEGLDIAATYLNQKPNATNITAAVYYPTEFSYVFKGHSVTATHWQDPSTNYTVIYRSMFERGASSWEQDVLNHFQNQTPEKIINLGGIPYVWIYKMDNK